MEAKRTKVIAVCLIFLFGLLLYRLATIQLISTERFGKENVNLLEASVEQRTQSVLLHNGRGSLLDRHGVPVTNPATSDVVFFPFLKDMDVPLEEVATIIDEPSWKIEQWIRVSEEPFYLSDRLERSLTDEEFKTFQEWNYPGMVSVGRATPGDPDIASHFLGVVRGKGASGLEETFEEFLAAKDEEKLLYHVDGKGDPLFGLKVNYLGLQDPYYPVSVKTTLDLDLQKKAEELIDASGMKEGGLVLLDVESRDVLALVSRPDMNPKDPNKYENKMLTSYSPGSVFKTVVAAAAIENPNVNTRETFNCDLGINEGEEPTRSLGVLTFEESFAQSCNYTFAKIANEMMAHDEDVLENYAAKLGLTEQVGWRGDVFRLKGFKQFGREDRNQIWGPDPQKTVPLAVSQTAIGQLDVQITPLSMANMMATIAAKGVKKEVRGATEILYRNGSEFIRFPEHIDTDNRLSSYSSLKLQELLQKVPTSEGTASTLQGLKIAGKSGTAEVENADGVKENQSHHWFAGYFPYDTPKYAMVVVTLNSAQSGPTYSVYKDMVSYLYQQEDIKELKRRDPAF
ncbi:MULTISPECIES: peptidoglycan D,D-transpeptidase FtsI family protein [Pontibacillus]|uniref:Penicillin-binding transpeptidase domain-containing protein n=1 Tax=Pontibacillus chungwhensis TaxID=265426 RepID=A0ABY8UXA9_9BACI|nr:penicillin-binding transpeptidase domain-containing protein [Pontibacillus chungwhensis]MCD5323663.1 penicillin-binding protein 2 [Pontibacillus sp. HN14]WIF97030.1 penicillin-binding transpeptidase domain-containing protein [Pontibacillus chungwhensis]